MVLLEELVPLAARPGAGGSLSSSSSAPFLALTSTSSPSAATIAAALAAASAAASSRGVKRRLDDFAPRAVGGGGGLCGGGFSAAVFANNVCKRLRKTREALRADIVDAAATSAAARAAPSFGHRSAGLALTAVSAPLSSGRQRFGGLSASSSSSFPPSLAGAGAWEGLPPSALAAGLLRPLPPPPAAAPVALPLGKADLWKVSGLRRLSASAGGPPGPLPLWMGPQPSLLEPREAVGRSRSYPLGYLEYKHWLQRVAPSSTEEEEALQKDDEAAEVVKAEGKVSGLELLRRLCQAAVPKGLRRRAVPALTKEEITLAESSLYGKGSPDEVLASRFSVDLTRGQLQCLRPKTWLNDEVINFYFKLLQERSRKAKEAPRCWFTNSFFWNKLSGGPTKGNADYNYKEVRRWTTKAKVDVFDLDFVIFPMNIGEMHWAMGAIDFKSHGFRYFDSMISRPHPNFVPFLQRYLDDEHRAKKGGPLADASSWTLLPLEVPQQENSYDCGVFTCCFAEFFSAGKRLDFGQEDMKDLRLRLAARVVKADEDWDDDGGGGAT